MTELNDRGPLVLLGGTERKQINTEILKRFIDLSGQGESAKIIILPAASEFGPEVAKKYRDSLALIHVADVEILEMSSRRMTSSASVLEKIEEASGIVFTGGDQLRLLHLMAETRLLETVIRKFREGTPVAGSSAGAMVMGEIAIVRGDGRLFYHHGALRLEPGFSLLKSMIVDTHFSARSRMGRLFNAVARHPKFIGLGIEEDTAAVVMPDNRLEVIGEGIVCIVDGLEIRYRDMPESSPDDRMTVEGFKVHILAAGHDFSLSSRKCLDPPADPSNRVN